MKWIYNRVKKSNLQKPNKITINDNKKNQVNSEKTNHKNKIRKDQHSIHIHIQHTQQFKRRY